MLSRRIVYLYTDELYRDKSGHSAFRAVGRRPRRPRALMLSGGTSDLLQSQETTVVIDVTARLAPTSPHYTNAIYAEPEHPLEMTDPIG